MRLSTFAFILSLLWAEVSFASQTDLARIVALQEAKIQALTKELETRIKPELESCKNANQKASWAEGRVCFLSNGSCPAGFTKQTGHIRAQRIYQDANNPASYLTPASFGDSSIGWHGAAPYRYGEYAGDLYLSTCCR
jgi:hypothetical protein